MIPVVMHYCRTAIEELQFTISLSDYLELLAFFVELTYRCVVNCFIYLTRNSWLVTLPLQVEIWALLGY
jgi:hypothetical protein